MTANMSLWATIGPVPVQMAGHVPRMDVYKGNLILSWFPNPYSGFTPMFCFMVIKPDKTWCLYKTSNCLFSNWYTTDFVNGYSMLLNGVFNVTQYPGYFGQFKIPDYFVPSGIVTLAGNMYRPSMHVCYSQNPPTFTTTFGPYISNLNEIAYSDSYFTYSHNLVGNNMIVSNFNGNSLSDQPYNYALTIGTIFANASTQTNIGVGYRDTVNTMQQKNGVQGILIQIGGTGPYYIQKVNTSFGYGGGALCQVDTGSPIYGNLNVNCYFTPLYTDAHLSASGGLFATDNNAFIGANNTTGNVSFFSGPLNVGINIPVTGLVSTSSIVLNNSDLYQFQIASGTNLYIYSTQGTLPKIPSYTPNTNNPNLDFSSIISNSGTVPKSNYLINFHRPVSVLGAFES